MDFHLVRAELRRLGKKNLFNMLMNQKESRCFFSGLCSFRFEYKGYSFCISEVLGKGCELEKLKKMEQEACESEEGPIIEEKVEVPLFDYMNGSSYNF
jgi:hypothetical protein